MTAEFSTGFNRVNLILAEKFGANVTVETFSARISYFTTTAASMKQTSKSTHFSENFLFQAELIFSISTLYVGSARNAISFL